MLYDTFWQVPVFLISFADFSHCCGNSCLVNVVAFLFSVKSTVFTLMENFKKKKKKLYDN